MFSKGGFDYSRCLVMMCVLGSYVMAPVTGLLLDDDADSQGERLTQLEAEVSALTAAMNAQKTCVTNMCEPHWSEWGSWAAWSDCGGNCDAGHASHQQSRTRQRTCLNDSEPDMCTGVAVETDHRPCNTVQLYGCLNNTSDGDFGLAYNFYDELAQSTCTAALTSAGHAAAVRRDCSTGHAVSCSNICTGLGYSCFDSLHVYRSFTRLQTNLHGQTDEGKQGLSMYRYFGCSGAGGCGANYCCCKW